MAVHVVKNYSQLAALTVLFALFYMSCSRSYDHTKYGPIVRVAPNQVAVADLETVKSVYTIKETYRKTKFYELLASRPIQTVFSTADVELHRKLRRLMASQMSE
ncbi:hypothetical protein E4U14_003412 [Claviceps sp. LM454 group G7]|nr:hypothetical protein E4U14_003412 [Claviceps sp. LM454 group G7]